MFSYTIQFTTIDPLKYVTIGGPAALIYVREKNKAGIVVGTYAVTVSVPAGSAGAQGGIKHVVGIPEQHFTLMAASGVYPVIDAQEPADTGADVLRNEYERWYRTQQQAAREGNEELEDIALAKLSRILRQAAEKGYDTRMWPGAYIIKR